MEFLVSARRAGGWLLVIFLWLWATVPKALDWVGRSTLPDDWRQLMAEKLPAVAAWLFSTPWQVPTVMALLLTAWMMWVTRPQALPTPLPVEGGRADPPPVAALETSQEDAPASVTPPFDPSGLYVGLMQVDTQHLAERRVIEVVALCFNATGHPSDIQRVAGAIKVSEVKNRTKIELFEMPPPWLLDDRTTVRGIKNHAEFMVVPEQRLPPDVTAKFSELREGYDLHLDLDALDVLVGSHDEPQPNTRLPLWRGMRLYRDQSRPQVGRDARATGLNVTFKLVPTGE